MDVKTWFSLKKLDFLYCYYKQVDPTSKKDLFSVLSRPPEEVDALNFEKFKKIFKHAYTYSPYYHEKYEKAGIKPEDIQTVQDIERIPLLEREEVKENRERILCSNVDRKKIFLTSTGGSTGTPLYFYHEDKEPYYYLRQRFFTMIGLPKSCNGAMIIRRKNTFVNRLKTAMWVWPHKLLYLNAMLMTPDSIDEFIQQAKRANIKYLWGYEGGMYHLATILLEKKITFPSIKCVMTTSSPLPDSHRSILEQAFHCDVFDQYGSCEVQWLGTECPKHHGLHMLWDIRRIEFVDQNGKNVPTGEYGDIVVTDLMNDSFPFIRYRNGDRGRRLDVSCSIPFPVMDSVKGRVTDLVKFSDGSCIAGDYLTTIFDAYPMATKAFQVIQRKDYSIELRYVPSSTPESESEVATVSDGLKKLIGGRAAFQTVKVDEIQHDRGKTRYVISELK